ncbi:alpha/beta hydrolase fold domain-containing protein [Naasia lichenicola]|uniref:Alpha/beta hydrolase n=1 Tax=Naasia lichenicola TaxID=2565933 RepID=A0A4S4FHQ8_9MICO|nr:alpha/beta hydrolase [Naasia lichenicola]THG29334.1 alpha/beta hydrolase [Naasia lichenicola]
MSPTVNDPQAARSASAARKGAAKPRIKLYNWLYSAIGKRVISPRLKPLDLQVTTRVIAEPTVAMVPTRHGLVRCFIYRPHPDAPLASGLPPVHINIHGGGFILTNPRQDDLLATYLAAEVGVVVVNVDYSTAPGALYPVAEEQCFDVAKWVADSGREREWDASRMSIGGASAGGKLALNVLQQAHSAGAPEFRSVQLVVPLVDASRTVASYQSPLAKPDISQSIVRLILGTYFVDHSRLSEPLAAPLLDPRLAEAVPSTLVLGAELDTLRPQIDDLVQMLRRQGSAVVYRCFDGLDHAFLAVATTPSDIIREALDLIGRHVIEHSARNPH